MVCALYPKADKRSFVDSIDLFVAQTASEAR